MPIKPPKQRTHCKDCGERIIVGNDTQCEDCCNICSVCEKPQSRVGTFAYDMTQGDQYSICYNCLDKETKPKSRRGKKPSAVLQAG